MNTTHHRERADELKERIHQALEIVYGPDPSERRFELSRLLLDLHFALIDAIEALERKERAA